jgi:hypothetical protein
MLSCLCSLDTPLTLLFQIAPELQNYGLMERALLERLRAQESVPLLTSPPVGQVSETTEETEEPVDNQTASRSPRWGLVRCFLDLQWGVDS